MRLRYAHAILSLSVAFSPAACEAVAGLGTYHLSPADGGVEASQDEGGEEGGDDVSEPDGAGDAAPEGSIPPGHGGMPPGKGH